MSGYGIQKKGTSPILKQAGSPGPTVPILPEDFTQGPKLPDDIAAKQKPRDTFKKGGMTKSQETVKTAMSKFKKGKLHSGSKKGPVVKSRKQAIAIALSEAGKSKKK
jgi:hypothetical protein